MADFSTLCSCLKEELAAAACCPNETSSTSEQTSILEPKEKEYMSPDPKHTHSIPHTSTLSRTKVTTQVNQFSI